MGCLNVHDAAEVKNYSADKLVKADDIFTMKFGSQCSLSSHWSNLLKHSVNFKIDRITVPTISVQYIYIVEACVRIIPSLV